MTKICIFGAGAIGGYIAACLSKTNVQLSLIARGPHKEAIEKKGLTFIKDGKMVTEGEQVVVGDVSSNSTVAYEVLCRRHHMRKVTSKVSNPAAEQSLPFNK